MSKKGRRASQEERLTAVQMLEKKYSADDVAYILNVGRSTILGWQKQYRDKGLAALSTKFASGRPTVRIIQNPITEPCLADVCPGQALDH